MPSDIGNGIFGNTAANIGSTNVTSGNLDVITANFTGSFQQASLAGLNNYSSNSRDILYKLA